MIKRLSFMSLDENKKFWEQAWADGRTRFHRQEANDNLIKYASSVFDPSDRILVPLCGKSIDLIWLAKQGHGVVGVELAKQAIDEFISENKIHGKWEDNRFQTNVSRLSLYHQDFFYHDGKYEAIYDRACLVALSKELRQRMAQKYKDLLIPKGKILLITLVHESDEGPPYSISDEEINNLFAADFKIEFLERGPPLERTVEIRKLTRIN